jgi:TPR repeat protein
MGIGTDVNLEEAFHWLKKLAEAGNPEGMYYLGMLYQFGKGTAEDPRQAYLWYRRAAEAGYPDGMYMTGWCLENQYGVGDEALEWYRRAQEGGVEAAGADIARLEAAEENESPPSG